MLGIIEAITLAAKIASVPPALLLSICFYESSLTNAVVPNDGGSASIGVCQVKKSTMDYVVKKFKLGKAYPSSLFVPETNAIYAAFYLRAQLDRYKGDIWLATDSFNKGTAVSHQSSYVKKVRRLHKTRPWVNMNVAI